MVANYRIQQCILAAAGVSWKTQLDGVGSLNGSRMGDNNKEIKTGPTFCLHNREIFVFVFLFWCGVVCRLND